MITQPMSVPKNPSGLIRTMAENQRITQCDAGDLPLAWKVVR
jgi:hypothetical protein